MLWGRVVALVAAAAVLWGSAGAGAGAGAAATRGGRGRPAGTTGSHRHLTATPIKPSEVERCSVGQEHRRLELLERALCAAPREVFLDLAPATPSHHQMSPSAVWVKRCVGLCLATGTSCVPSAVRQLDIPVSVVDVGTGRQWCGTRAVLEHLECGCACPRSPADCAPAQRFSRERCACECANHRDRRRCRKPNHWNRAKCTCEPRNSLVP